MNDLVRLANNTFQLEGFNGIDKDRQREKMKHLIGWFILLAQHRFLVKITRYFGSFFLFKHLDFV